MGVDGWNQKAMLNKLFMKLLYFTRCNLAAEQNGIVIRFNVIQTCHQLINILVFNFISNMFLHHKVESLLFEERYFCAVIDRNG